MELLFSYGTLQKETVQRSLFGRVLSQTADFLEGYKIIRIEINDPEFLAKGENRFQNTLAPASNNKDKIKGTVLELTPEELDRADQYEPVGYTRKKVKLVSGRDAWIYMHKKNLS